MPMITKENSIDNATSEYEDITKRAFSPSLTAKLTAKAVAKQKLNHHQGATTAAGALTLTTTGSESLTSKEKAVLGAIAAPPAILDHPSVAGGQELMRTELSDTSTFRPTSH